MPEAKTILITGGTRRLGKAIAAHYAAQGWRLVLSYLSDDGAAELTRSELQGAATSVRVARCDTSSHAQ